MFNALRFLSQLVGNCKIIIAVVSGIMFLFPVIPLSSSLTCIIAADLALVSCSLAIFSLHIRHINICHRDFPGSIWRMQLDKGGREVV